MIAVLIWWLQALLSVPLWFSSDKVGRWTRPFANVMGFAALWPAMLVCDPRLVACWMAWWKLVQLCRSFQVQSWMEEALCGNIVCKVCWEFSHRSIYSGRSRCVAEYKLFLFIQFTPVQVQKSGLWGGYLAITQGFCTFPRIHASQ